MVEGRRDVTQEAKVVCMMKVGAIVRLNHEGLDGGSSRRNHDIGEGLSLAKALS